MTNVFRPTHLVTGRDASGNVHLQDVPIHWVDNHSGIIRAYQAHEWPPADDDPDLMMAVDKTWTYQHNDQNIYIIPHFKPVP